MLDTKKLVVCFSKDLPMNNLSVQTSNLITMSSDEIEKVRELERVILTMPQAEIPTKQLLHAGMYARTMFVAAGVTVVGAFMKCATTLIISGDMKVYIGKETVELKGYNIVPASANRKQAGYAITDTYVTMLFPTNAKTVEEAEEELTDEVDKLMSRKGGNNNIMVTGE